MRLSKKSQIAILEIGGVLFSYHYVNYGEDVIRVNTETQKQEKNAYWDYDILTDDIADDNSKIVFLNETVKQYFSEDDVLEYIGEKACEKLKAYCQE